MTLVRLDRDEGGLAVATFDSPPPNLFNRRLFEDLQGVVEAVRDDAGDLFATEDLQRAVQTFLRQGPRPRRVSGR